MGTKGFGVKGGGGGVAVIWNSCRGTAVQKLNRKSHAYQRAYY